jgi:ParB family chromosome partitioning protein
MSSNSKKRPALGKGLSALLESSATDITSKEIGDGSVLGSIAMIPVTSIEANPFNPRTDFEQEALEELSRSIQLHGIIQPLTVRKLGRNRYQLISGERRFKASKLADLEEVPAYIRVANDQAMLEMALVENIQREDLNAIEVALSYKRLIDECNLTQEELAKKIGKSRTAITNHLRLLKLPPKVQLGVRENEISMGHARTLVSAGSEELQIKFFEDVIKNDISVRQLEQLIRDKNQATKNKTANETKKINVSQEHKDLGEQLASKISAKVQISKSPKGGGKLVINFNSDVDLNRIIEILNN